MKYLRLPKITFGIIVLNGEPFLLYNLRSLYPFAYQIIVVEGSVPAASENATVDGHSTDGTLEALWQFKRDEDFQNKLLIVTAEDEGFPNGFWPDEKNQQSQAYARRATGEYLWQVDIDEFYKTEDIQYVFSLLKSQPEITAVSFNMITFWGGFDYVTNGWYLKDGAELYHRLFKWAPDYSYITHRPPTVYDEYGQNLRDGCWVQGKTLAAQGIYLYHYSLVFPKQIMEKCRYYDAASWAPLTKAQSWAKDIYFGLKNPFRVHNVYDYPSWLSKFVGTHPEQINIMRQDLISGRLLVSLRPTQDIDRLLMSHCYAVIRWGLNVLFYFWQKNPSWRVKNYIERVTNWAIGH